MRILIAAADQCPPLYPSVRGIFGEGLLAFGHEVPAVLYGAGPQGCWPGAVEFIPRPSRSLMSLPTSIVRELAVLRRALDRIDHADLTIVRDDALVAIEVARRRRRFGPLVFQVSHLLPEEVRSHADLGIYGHPVGNRLKATAATALRSMALHAASRIVVMTPEAASALRVGAKRSLVLPEGVSRDWEPDMDTASLRRSLDIQPEVPLIAYAGTLNRVRDLDTFLRAFALVLISIPDAVLVIAGSGREATDAPHLVETARQLEIRDNVRFVSSIAHARVAALLDASDIAVSPIPDTPVLRCNSPTKVFEAMHRARAVVASDIPEQRRVVEASHGGLVVPHRADAYAAAVTSLLREPAARGEMGRSGRAWVLENRTYELLASRVNNLAKSLVGLP